MLKYIPKLKKKKKIHVNRTSKMFYSIEAVTERGARGHYCYAAKLFRLCTYLNVEVDRESLGSTEHFGAKFIIFRAKKIM